MSKKKEHEKEPNHERWLLSYADFITLLMIFFIVLYSASSVDAKKYSQIKESFSIAMGGGASIIEMNPDGGGTVEDEEQKGNGDEANKNESSGGQKSEASQTEQIKEELDKYLSGNGLKASVRTEITERGLVVSLNDTAFFDSGRAVIRNESRARLIEIGKIINKLEKYVRIEGHTDNVPISNYEFKSNWQLSAIRATNVTELLIAEAHIPPSKIAAVGYGEYRPIDDNRTDQGRAKNRRVDIVILDSKYNGAEVNKQ